MTYRATEMQIRRASVDDIASVRELSRAAYARWVPVIGREPRPMTASYERAIREHVIDLCVEQDGPIALIEMALETTSLLVVNIAVLPAYQRRGIGDRLLTHAETLARSHALTSVRLYTNRAFTSNIAFYARRGYLEYADEPLADGGALIHMTKRLDA